MATTIAEPKFNCAACGKEYRWKPELAGKKAKCKCGGVIAVPAAAPVAGGAASGASATVKPAARPAPKPAEQEVDFDGLYALAQEETKATARSAGAVDESAGGYRCPSCSAPMPPGAAVCPRCQTNLRTGARQAVAAGGRPGNAILAAAGAYAAATPTARAGILPYGGGGAGAAGRVSRADQDILYEGGKARSLYLPLGLIILGILFYFGQLAFSNNKLTAGLMIGLVGVRVFMDSVLIFISMLFAVRGFDMGFGAFGPGVLKILAIAMGPGALGQLMTQWVGGGMGGLMVGGFVTIVLYYTLIKVLFNLDLGETFLLVFLIYGVQQVLGTFLLVALIGMASSGAMSSEQAGAVGLGAAAVATAGDDGQYIPPKRMMQPSELAALLDKGSQGTLNDVKGGDDPRAYLETHPLYNFAGMDKKQSSEFLERLEALGAGNIRVTSYDTLRTPAGEPYASITRLILELPADPVSRKKIFDLRADMEKKLGLKPEMVQVETGGRPEESKMQAPLKDWGQTLLDLRLRKDTYNWSSLGGEEEDDEEMDDAPAAQPAPAPTDGAPQNTGSTDAPPPAPEAPGNAAPNDTPPPF